MESTVRIRISLPPEVERAELAAGRPAEPRTIAFRRLAAPPEIVAQGLDVWASDALLALRYGHGAVVYPRAIVLALPRSARPPAARVLSAADFVPFRNGAPTVLGWVHRPELSWRGGWLIGCAPEFRDHDWASEVLAPPSASTTSLGL